MVGFDPIRTLRVISTDTRKQTFVCQGAANPPCFRYGFRDDQVATAEGAPAEYAANSYVSVSILMPVFKIAHRDGSATNGSKKLPVTYA